MTCQLSDQKLAEAEAGMASSSPTTVDREEDELDAAFEACDFEIAEESGCWGWFMRKYCY